MPTLPKAALALSTLSLLLAGCAHTGSVVEDTRPHDARTDFVPANPEFAALANGTTPTDRWSGVLGGAGYRIEVPTSGWNGKLVMYAHGYAGTGKSLVVQDPPIRRYLVDNGYAWAASSYSKNYYDVRAGVEDTNALALAFNTIAARNGRPLPPPTKTFIFGRSMGGHIAAAAVEAETLATANNKMRYDGAVPTCGVLDDEQLWAYFGGYQLAAQQLAGLPTATLPVTNWPQIATHVRTTLFNSTTSFANPAPQGLLLKSIVKNLTGGERPLFDQGFANDGLQNVVWGTFGDDGTVRGILNANGVDTRGVRYSFDAPEAVVAAFNTSIGKSIPAPDANRLRRDGLRWIPKVHADFAVPVLTIHTLGDMYVPFGQEQSYQSRAAARGKAPLLVQRAIRGYGHCDFTVAEQAQALADLVVWVEQGVKPAGDDVTTSATVANPAYGCRFTDNTLGADDSAAVKAARAPGKIPACPAKAQPATQLVSGIDTRAFDPSVRVQDDFYGHINGLWAKTTPIPASKARWGTYDQLRETAGEQVRTLLAETVKNPGAPGSETRKIADLYLSFVDEKARNAHGVKPLQADLARIAGLRDKQALPALLAHLRGTGVTTPFDLDVYQDAKDATRYAVYASQSGLGLPDRDYYLKDDDAKLKTVRGAYLKHVETLLAMGGDRQASAHAADVLALETALAQAQWTRVESRDALKSYNPVPFDKLGDLAPGFDWKAHLAAAGVAGKADFLVVRQPSYFTAMAAVVERTPLDAWKSYLTWHVLASYAPYLSNAFVEERFNFTGKTLRGVPENEPQWQLAQRLVDFAMGEAVGKLYVAKYFPPENKARVQAMVDNFLATFREGIDTLEWMGPATKKEAQAKLAVFRPNIGYPDKWRDYSALQTTPDDLVANVRAARVFAYQRGIHKLGQPVDRGEWSMLPQTVNAQFSPLKNAITFPAALLQPPFFNVMAEDAVNYGAVGTSIGHEISHGFDDQGSQYDGQGNLRNWWTAEDRANFSTRAAGLVQQYSAFSPVKGYFVNGKFTLGENIGDNSGVAVAYKAYRRSLGGKPSPVLDGLSGEQRLFIGFGIKYRSLQREDAAIMQIKTDPHSPGEFRVRGTVANQPGFYEAFGIQAGDKMYVPPEKRVIMW